MIPKTTKSSTLLGRRVVTDKALETRTGKIIPVGTPCIIEEKASSGFWVKPLTVTYADGSPMLICVKRNDITLEEAGANETATKETDLC